MMTLAEVGEYEGFLASLYPVSLRISIRLYREKNFRKLRSDFNAFLKNPKTCTVMFMPNEIEHLNTIKEYEKLFWCQYDAAVNDMLKKSFMMLLPHRDDVIQDCRLLVVENIWEYDGRAGLHTFMHKSINHLLQALIRKYELIAGPSKVVACQIAKARKIMREKDISYEEAVEQLKKPNLNKYKFAQKQQEDFEARAQFLTQQATLTDRLREELALLSEAMESVELSPIQRVAINTFLEGTSLSDTAQRLNYTRQHLSAQFLLGVDKLREFMVEDEIAA